MTNATKNTTPIREAEKALHDARTTLNERRHALQGTNAAIEATKCSWERGDNEPPATRLVELRAETERLTPLIAAAEREVKAAERKLKLLTPVLAEKVADALGDFIYGATAEVATSAPTKATSTPQVQVVEVNERYRVDSHGQRANAHCGGSIGGDVELYLTGPDYMTPMDSTAVVMHLRSRGVMTGGTGHVSGPHVQQRGTGVYLAKFRIARVVPLMPTIPKIGDVSIANLCDRGLFQVFQNSTYSHMAGDYTLSGTARTHKVSEEITEGIRHVVLDASIETVPHGSNWNRDRAANQAEQFLTEQFHTHKGIDGIGTITDTAVTRETIKRDRLNGHTVIGDKTTARITLVSTPTDNPT